MNVLRFALVAGAILWTLERVPAAQITLRPAWVGEGNETGAGFGSGVSGAGDVDGDGYDDVIVTAYRADGDQPDEGRAYLFLGSRDGLAKLPSWTVESDQASATLGPAAAAGDVNGDGFDDVIVGSQSYSNDLYLEGRAQLYLGSATGLAASPAWSAEGDQLNANLGGSVAGAGDVNGDGFDDVLVGVVQYTNGQQAEGQARLYLGSAAGLAPLPVWSAEGNQGFAVFAVVASAGDVNSDGFDDVIVGAPSFNNGQIDEGRAFLYLGSAAGPSLLPDWSAEGNQADASFGNPVGSAGDVNGDGFGDVVVGAHTYDDGKGRAFLYLGSPTGLGATPAWTVGGSLRSELFGWIRAAGDLDGDGFDDVIIGIIGAPGFRNGQSSEGRACAYYGSPTGLVTYAGWCFEGNQRDAALGFPVSPAGDVNGDGFSDVLVGAYQFNGDLLNEGRAFLFQGSDRRRLR
jgi:VCBS repeat protein/FG-GAP repeat protein